MRSSSFDNKTTLAKEIFKQKRDLTNYELIEKLKETEEERNLAATLGQQLLDQNKILNQKIKSLENEKNHKIDSQLRLEIESALTKQVRTLQSKFEKCEQSRLELFEKFCDMENEVHILKREKEKRNGNEEKLDERCWELEIINQQKGEQIAEFHSELNKLKIEQRKFSQENNNLQLQIENFKQNELQLKLKSEDDQKIIHSLKKEKKSLNESLIKLSKELSETKLSRNEVPSSRNCTPEPILVTDDKSSPSPSISTTEGKNTFNTKSPTRRNDLQQTPPKPTKNEKVTTPTLDEKASLIKSINSIYQSPSPNRNKNKNEQDAFRKSAILKKEEKKQNELNKKLDALCQRLHQADYEIENLKFISEQFQNENFELKKIVLDSQETIELLNFKKNEDELSKVNIALKQEKSELFLNTFSKEVSLSTSLNSFKEFTSVVNQSSQTEEIEETEFDSTLNLPFEKVRDSVQSAHLKEKLKETLINKIEFPENSLTLNETLFDTNNNTAENFINTGSIVDKNTGTKSSSENQYLLTSNNNQIVTSVLDNLSKSENSLMEYLQNSQKVISNTENFIRRTRTASQDVLVNKRMVAPKRTTLCRPLITVSPQRQIIKKTFVINKGSSLSKIVTENEETKEAPDQSNSESISSKSSSNKCSISSPTVRMNKPFRSFSTSTNLSLSKKPESNFKLSTNSTPRKSKFFLKSKTLNTEDDISSVISGDDISIVDDDFSEVEEVFINNSNDEVEARNPVEALTHTMIGSWFQKFNRRGKNAHHRFFWINPYLRTLNWSVKPPSQEKKPKKHKTAFIDSVTWQELPEANVRKTYPPGAENCITLFTNNRKIVIIPLNWFDHELWTMGLTLLMKKSGNYLDNPLEQDFGKESKKENKKSINNTSHGSNNGGVGIGLNFLEEVKRRRLMKEKKEYDEKLNEIALNAESVDKFEQIEFFKRLGSGEMKVDEL
ncbi:hypothetical protein HDU92_006949 [Lobulomyces angularis]|nr:hypothetical protein HDU92_006949 [Lobulomyces angularis]